MSGSRHLARKWLYIKFSLRTARNKKIYLVFLENHSTPTISVHPPTFACRKPFHFRILCVVFQMWLVCLFCENWFSNCHKIKFWLNEILSSNYSRTIYTHTHRKPLPKKEFKLRLWHRHFINLLDIFENCSNEWNERKKTDAKILETLWTIGIKESICLFHQIEHRLFALLKRLPHLLDKLFEMRFI